MEGRQISVAISDAFLCTVSFVGSYQLWNLKDSGIESLCIGAVGLAACSGVIRFGIFPSIKPLHQFLSLLAADAVALLCLAIWSYQDDDPVDRMTRLAFCLLLIMLVVLPLWAWGMASQLELFQAMVIGLCLILLGHRCAILWSDRNESNMFLSAVGLYLVSSLLIGTKGTMMGLKRVDVFHFFLTLANWCFVHGIMLQRT